MLSVQSLTQLTKIDKDIFSINYKNIRIYDDTSAVDDLSLSEVKERINK